MQVPEEEKYLNTKAELHDMIVGLLGGRAAEELKFDTVTTGASNDIEKATSIARNMVTMYGMSKKYGLMGLATVENQYLEGRSQLNCSDVTAAGVDEEVREILEDCYKEAKELLSQNLDAMDKLAAYLIERETITGKEFMRIYREVKGLPQEPEKSDVEKMEEDFRRATAAPSSQKTDRTAAPVNSAVPPVQPAPQPEPPVNAAASPAPEPPVSQPEPPVSQPEPPAQSPETPVQNQGSPVQNQEPPQQAPGTGKAGGDNGSANVGRFSHVSADDLKGGENR
jgi:cell division protease FtsH